MMLKLAKQINNIDMLKTFTKLKWSPCIKEHLMILKIILDKYVIFIKIINS